MMVSNFTPVVLVAAAVGLVAPASAQETSRGLTDRQLEIIQIVRNAEGYIDEALHTEFWGLMPEGASEAIGAEIEKAMNGGLAGIRTEFNEQSWIAARDSLQAGKAVRSKRYLEARTALLNGMDNAAYRAATRKGVEQAENIIEAAASRTPAVIEGVKVYITPELIDQVLAGVDASEERFRKLASPVWDGQVREYRYPAAYVAVLDGAPFVESSDDLTLPNGLNMKSISLSQTSSESVYRGITFTPFGSFAVDPDKAVVSAIEGGLETIGALGSEPSIKQWRGMPSAEADGVAVTSDGNFYASMKVAYSSDHNALFQFIVISTVSSPDAWMKLDELEASTMILR